MDIEPASAPAPASALRPGRLIDGFRLDAYLHRGGMAHLWQVSRVEGPEGTADPTPLVMKVPRLDVGEDPAAVVGFEVEQMILPTLTGPHVPRFVARGEFTRQPYLVMERIEGESLRPRLDRAPLPIREILAIARSVSLALHDLHRQHLVHLDVKPSNIMFRPDGTAVLVDFGLSRHDRLPDLLEEEFRLPLGTGPYMSPEQVRRVRDDPRSDLYALGVMLYHFTTGERPFGAPTTVRGLRRRLYAEPVPPRALRADCPAWLQEVVLTCLEVDPERRWQSAAQLALVLQDVEQLPLSARAHSTRAGGLLERLRRWKASFGAEARAQARLGAASQLMKSPIVLAAVDIDGAAAGLLEQQREAVRRIVAAEPGARLACVCVLRASRVAPEPSSPGQTSRHVKQLVGLRHWARPLGKALGLDEKRLTFHVLEAAEPAAAIVDFAERNQVDHIVMGARGTSALRRYLGSVSSQVVAQSSCSVTVVRS
jgi:nucleotide-binding universal stress UspA family protein